MFLIANKPLLSILCSALKMNFECKQKVLSKKIKVFRFLESVRAIDPHACINFLIDQSNFLLYQTILKKNEEEVEISSLLRQTLNAWYLITKVIKKIHLIEFKVSKLT